MFWSTDEKLKKAKQELADIEQKISQKNGEYFSTVDFVEKKKKELNEFRRILELEKEEIKQKREENKIILDKIQEDVIKKNWELLKLDKEILDKKNKVDYDEKEYRKLVEQIRKDISDKETEKNNLIAAIKDLNEQYVVLNETVIELTTKMKNKETELNRFTILKQEQLDLLQNDIEELSAKKRALNMVVKWLESSIVNNKELIKNQEKEIAARYEDSKTIIAELDEELENKRKEFDEYKNNETKKLQDRENELKKGEKIILQKQKECDDRVLSIDEMIRLNFIEIEKQKELNRIEKLKLEEERKQIDIDRKNLNDRISWFEAEKENFDIDRINFNKMKKDFIAKNLKNE